MTWPRTATDHPRPGIDAGTPDGISVVGVVNTVLTNRMTIAVTTLVTAAAVVALTLAAPRVYTATTSFIPVTGGGDESALTDFTMALSSGSRAAALAPTLEFYALILHSQSLLEAVADASYRVESGGNGRTGDLNAIFGYRGGRHAREDTMRQLERAVAVSADPRTRMVRLSVRTPWPDLSYQVARQILAELDGLVASTRAQTASAEVHFAADRVAEARETLHLVETGLQRFLARNRDFTPSSPVGLEVLRRQREIRMQQELYVSLYQAWTRANLDALRRTPTIVVVEPPTQPATPDDSRVWINLSFATVLGLTLGVAGAFARASAGNVGLPRPSASR